jgi:hypothetical protein
VDIPLRTHIRAQGWRIVRVPVGMAIEPKG